MPASPPTIDRQGRYFRYLDHSFRVSPIGPHPSERSFEDAYADHVRAEGVQANEVLHLRSATAFTSRDAELWHHKAAIARMHYDLKKPIPQEVLRYAYTASEYYAVIQVLEPSLYSQLSIHMLIAIYGITYGVYPHLESYHLATGAVNHDNVDLVARRMSMLMGLRDYIDQYWIDIVHRPPETGPSPVVPVNRGVYQVRCNVNPPPPFSSLPHSVESVQAHLDLESDYRQEDYPVHFNLNLSSPNIFNS